jgi:hypothetical protein
VKPNYELMGVIAVLLAFWGWIAYIMSWGTL